MLEVDSVINPWTSEDAQKLLKLHFREQVETGIYRSYVSACDGVWGTTNISHSTNQAEISRLARSELPLEVFVDKSKSDDSPSFYFLTKIDPFTGKEVNTHEHENMILVGKKYADGHIELSDEFTDEQAAVIFRHADELEAAHLMPNLAN